MGVGNELQVMCVDQLLAFFTVIYQEIQKIPRKLQNKTTGALDKIRKGHVTNITRSFYHYCRLSQLKEWMTECRTFKQEKINMHT